jgi:hypothetical protein
MIWPNIDETSLSDVLVDTGVVVMGGLRDDVV